jgi:hypothetical protein
MAGYLDEMEKAKAAEAREPGRADYWRGYQKGLKSAHAGIVEEVAESEAEGYAAGKEVLGRPPIAPGQMGAPVRFPPSSKYTFRLWDRIRDRLPEKGAAQFINEAIEEKLEKEGRE